MCSALTPLSCPLSHGPCPVSPEHMPNGHGGSVRFLSVGVILFLLAGVFAAYHNTGEPLWRWLGYGLAALGGERFAHHLHRWKYDESGGAYYSWETHAAVRKLYIVAAIIYVMGAVVAWHFLTTAS